MSYRRESIELQTPELPVRAVIKSSESGVITADAHLHLEIELIRVLEGSLNIHFTTQGLTISEGQIIFINSMVVHSTTIPKDTVTKILVLQFNPFTIYNQSIFLKHHFLLSFINREACMYYLLSVDIDEKHKEIADLTVKVILELEQKDIAYEISIKSYLYRILSLLYRGKVLPMENGKLINNYELFTKLEPIIEYTEMHYMEDIKVDSISQMAHFNYSYFCRLFKKATGKSYIDFLNYVRVAEAEKLLRSTDLSITEILEKTGFTSLSYFNRVYKKQNGMKPSAYRKHMASLSLF